MSIIPKNCVTAVAAKMGGKINAQTLAYVQQQINAAIPPGAATPHNMQAAAARFQQRAALASVIQRRNAAINAVTYGRIHGYVTTAWKGREAEGLRALMTGSIEGRRGARVSVGSEQQLLRARYEGGMLTEMERAGVRQLFSSGAVDQDVSRALWQASQSNPNMAGISREAQTIAGIVRKYQDAARADANAAGAWIGKLDDWIVSQSHDRWKIEKAQFQDWATKIGTRLDWPRIEAQQGGPIVNKAAWLQEVYTNIVTGDFNRATGAQNTSGFIGPRNLAKSMSESRVLHFKSADDWFTYNQEFGSGNLREAILHGFGRTARNTGLMRVFGTNPEAMFNRVVKEITETIRASGDIKAQQKFASATANGGWLRNRLAEIDGSVSNPVSQTVAKWGGTVRAVQSLSKLGLATISSFADIGTAAADVNFQGGGFLTGVRESIEGAIRGRPPTEAKEILAQLGVFFDSMVGEMARAGSLDDTVPGAVSRGLQRFFKWNGLDWWTESLRSANAMGILHRFATHKGKVFADLPERLQKTMALYDIDAADWDVMRAGAVRAIDGKDFITAAGMPQSIADKLSRFVSDRANQAVLKPDADAAAMMLRGIRGGTVHGEILRFIMQFKSFPAAYTRQAFGKEIFGYGEKAFEAGAVRGLAQLVIATTLLGYGSITVKDMIKGKKPPDPSKMTPEQFRDVFFASMVQGGAYGIYGDYLFGQANRFGASPIESIAGPTLGTASQIVELYQKARDGEKAGADALRLAINNTPYVNLPLVRTALDYAIIYEWQEALNPGYLRRLEQRARKERGQEYFSPPSEAAQ
ncbi:MAG: hypothetical protein AB7F22_17765 [Reyranella sp.]|uniref:hypothetical protein n=1 Tax=Reyranella sp. TaxID=1929291 RepID=UPI003D14AA68